MQIRRWANANQSQYRILHAKLLVQTYERGSGGPGNGQAAWQALKDKYACCTKETRRVECEALVNSSMDQGQDTDDYFISLDKRRARLAENLEAISDERVEDNMQRAYPVTTKIFATPVTATRPGE